MSRANWISPLWEKELPARKPGPARTGRDDPIDRRIAWSTEEIAKLMEDRKQDMTYKQRLFCEKLVEENMTPMQAAIEAGYKEERATNYASRLLNGRDFPHVLLYVEELQERKRRKYGVTLDGQLERLARLSQGAEDAKQFSAAITAEKTRAALGGLTTDRRETVNVIDTMTRDQLMQKLEDLTKKYPALAGLLGEYGQKHPEVIDAEVVDVTEEKESLYERTRSEIMEYHQALHEGDRPVGEED